MTDEISEEVKNIGELLSRKLDIARKSLTITPDNPITGKQLAEAYNLKFSKNIDDSDIREAINYERSIGVPIATGKGCRGYYKALNDEELEYTKAQMKSRIKKEFRALSGLDKAFIKSDLGKLLQEKLDLQANNG